MKLTLLVLTLTLAAPAVRACTTSVCDPRPRLGATRFMLPVDGSSESPLAAPAEEAPAEASPAEASPAEAGVAGAAARIDAATADIGAGSFSAGEGAASPLDNPEAGAGPTGAVPVEATPSEKPEDAPGAATGTIEGAPASGGAAIVPTPMVERRVGVRRRGGPSLLASGLFAAFGVALGATVFGTALGAALTGLALGAAIYGLGMFLGGGRSSGASRSQTPQAPAEPAPSEPAAGSAPEAA